MHITRQVFRHMEIAFLVAVCGIYILLLYQKLSASDHPVDCPTTIHHRHHTGILAA